MQKLNDKYSTLLDEEQQILREEFNRFNGKVMDTAGDGFFVTFKTTQDAIECAVAIQKKMSLHEWTGNEEVKIRIGIHTGRAKVSESGYTGIDIHRTERIMSFGYGGQVLISEAAKVLVENQLSSDVEIKYLGEYNLKDLQNPEKIYQLVIVLTQLGELDKAEELIEKCLKINEKLAEERAYGLIYNNLGSINFIRGNLTDARDNFLKSLKKRIEIGDTRGEGFLCTNIAWVEIVMGNYNAAEGYLERSLGIHSALSDKHLMSWALSNYALLELYRGNFKRAEELVKDSIRNIEESVSEWGISYEILLYGIILYQLNDKEKGIEKILKSISFYKKIKSKWGTRRGLLNLGIVYLDMGDLEKSKECFKEALEISLYLKDKVGFAEIFENTALIFLKNGNSKEAKRFYEAAVSIREKIKAPMNYVALRTHEENLNNLNVQKLEEFDLESLIESIESIRINQEDI